MVLETELTPAPRGRAPLARSRESARSELDTHDKTPLSRPEGCHVR